MTWQSAGRAIWRYRWLAAGLTVLLVLVTGLLVGRQTPTYEATSEVRLVQKVPAGDVPALDVAAQNAASYSLLVGGNEFAKLVAAEAAATLPGLTPLEANKTLSAKPVPGTDVLQVLAQGTNPDRITAIANAAIPALQKLAITQGGHETILAVDTAVVPTSPVSPRVKLAIAVALILGLVINGSLMVLLDLLRDRFADSDELQEATSRPVLATVPLFGAESFVSSERPRAPEAGPARDDERNGSSSRRDPDDLADERSPREPARRKRP